MAAIQFKVTNGARVAGKYSASLMLVLHGLDWPVLQRLALRSLGKQVELAANSGRAVMEGRELDGQLWLAAWRQERVAFFHLALAMGVELPDGCLLE